MYLIIITYKKVHPIFIGIIREGPGDHGSPCKVGLRKKLEGNF